jgi:hypothetical protein
MKNHNILIFLVVVFLASCSRENSSLATLSPPSPSQQATTKTNSSGSVVTQPAILPATTLPPTPSHATNMPSPSPTITHIQPLVEECVDLTSIPSVNVLLSGTIILASPPPGDNDILLLDLATSEKQLVSREENEVLSQVALSPNRNLFAYRKTRFDTMDQIIEDILIIENSKGEQLVARPYATKDLKHPQTGQWETFQWLNDQHLLLQQYAEVGGQMSLVLDPFTDEEQQLIPWGHYDYFDPTAEFGLLWDTLIHYSPDLTRVIYPGLTDDIKPSIVLWDLEQKTLIANIPAQIYAMNENPSWSPDGTQFVIGTSENLELSTPSHQELFAINRGGDIKQLTSLTTLFEEVTIGHFTWSPNGQFIAFWFRDNASANPNEILAIINTNTQNVDIYCVQSPLGMSPMWSPDSYKLALTGLVNSEESPSITIIDLQNQIAASIPGNFILKGWLR